MSSKYILSIEVQKYPYCGRTDEIEDYLSDKICCYTIRSRKKLIKKAKWLEYFVLRLTNGIVASSPKKIQIINFYPYSYGDELTPEMAQSNRNKMLTILY